MDHKTECELNALQKIAEGERAGINKIGILVGSMDAMILVTSVRGAIKNVNSSGVAQALISICDRVEKTVNEKVERLKGGPKNQIPTTMEITSFFHCAKCMEEKPPGISPQDWLLIEVGKTPIGVQIWCRRHNLNVIHIDLEGQALRAR